MEITLLWRLILQTQENEISCAIFFKTGSEMIHLPWWLNVWRIDFNTTFCRNSRPVFLKIVLLKFLRNSQENNCGEFSSQQSCRLRACKFLWIFEIFNNAFSIEHPRWLLLVLQVYLHPIINLNMKVLKVLQVSV